MTSPWRRYGFTAVLAACWSGPAGWAHAQGQHVEDGAADPVALTELSLEQLADLDVTSVSRKREPRFTAPAAVFVLEGEQILRSGVTSLPDALRLIPGVHVARHNANQWSVGIRGFGSRLSRSVLVLIDGRSVYSPLYAGTYWELQDLLLEDVDRIEVIRGPGGTLWGANAFNGVINIITKPARSTTGLLATAAAGTEQRGMVGLRQGASLGDDAAYRVYAKLFDRDAGYRSSDAGFDDWRMARAGTRFDLKLGSHDRITAQGDLYYGRAGMRVQRAIYEPPFRLVTDADSKLSGGNVLGRWERQLSATAEARAQVYYDRTARLDPNFHERRDTLDLDVDHRFELWESQEITWGLGYRVTHGRTKGYDLASFDPADRTDHLWQAFLQDSFFLWQDRLRLVLGSKVEHNAFSGFELQPSARLAFLVSEQVNLWTAVSRAVRTPAAIEQDVEATLLTDAPPSPAPTFLRLQRNRDFGSEKVLASEAGMRLRPRSSIYLALTGFYNRFDDLLSVEAGMPFTEDMPPPLRQIVPVRFGNGLRGRSIGVELTYDLSPMEGVRLQGYYAFLDLDLTAKPGSTDMSSAQTLEGGSAQHHAVVRLGLDLPARLRLDVTGRFVDELPAAQVDRYVEADVRLAFRPRDNLELSVVGQNLLAPHHHEGEPTELAITEVERGFYGKVSWQW